MTTKKDGRKTKQFALRASVNGTRVWENLTDEERKARIDRLQAGRRKWQAEKEQIDAWSDYANSVSRSYDELYSYDPNKKTPAEIPKPRSLNLVDMEGFRVPPMHETPDLDLKDAEKMPEVGALAAFNSVATHKRARTMVTRLKELALKDDGFEITADNEYVGISWVKLQALVYKIMKEMDEA